MAIIYSYPIVTPTTDDLLLGTDQGAEGKPTKNFTISSIVDLISAGATGLGAVIEINSSAKNALGVNQSASDFANISGTGGVTFGSFRWYHDYHKWYRCWFYSYNINRFYR